MAYRIQVEGVDEEMKDIITILLYVTFLIGGIICIYGMLSKDIWYIIIGFIVCLIFFVHEFVKYSMRGKK